jgi:hypothetical protein
MGYVTLIFSVLRLCVLLSGWEVFLQIKEVLNAEIL